MRIAKHIWTFLTMERSLGGTPVPRRHAPKRRRRQRGVALITVLIAIALTLVISNQFGTSTNIDMISAANYRDQMRAQFLARSASNLSELVIRLQQRIDNIKELRGMVQITDFADQVLLAFCGSAEEVQAAVGFSSSDAKGLGADIGSCGIVGQITTEDDKINVNCANGTDATAATLKSALDALVFFPAYDPLFEEADAEGYRRDRAMQVSAMIDYIDSNGLKNRDRGTTEDYGYESLKDPYKPKNNYIDTVGELKLARGIDDRFWTLFGSAFTVYGGCKTNLSALSNSQLVAAILYLAAKNPNDPLLQNPQKLFMLAGLVAKAKQFGMTFTTLDDFIDFVKDPASQLGEVAGGSSTQGSAANAAMSAGIPGLSSGEKLGMELDKAKLGQMATAGPRRTYRVQAWGEIERKQKNADGSPVYPPIRSTLTGVWDTKVVLQNARKPPVPKGAWVFLRED
ncbi:MAG: general secretion pathway protein GspK [Deltaproteobacteria bacterium]|nr:general secretion pathway protein GspK [Deltaproteobacteria bacterium]